MVCLQYYMMQRQRFLEIQPDDRGKFSDGNLVYFFLLFPRYDVKKTPYSIPSSVASSVWVDRYDFVTFLFNVTRNVLSRIAAHLPARHRILEEDCARWCGAKVFNNLGQLLVTSRFLNLHVQDYAARIRTSIVNTTHLPYDSRPIVADGLTKFFPNPGSSYLVELNFKNKPPYDNTATAHDVGNHSKNRLQAFQSRIPVPYTHFFFSPDRPVTQFMVSDIVAVDASLSERDALVSRCERQDAVLYELAKHMDITLMGKVDTDLRNSTPGKRDHYLPPESLNIVRVRHAFVIRQNQLWTNVVANMATTEKLQSDASPMFISKQAWRWFESRKDLMTLGKEIQPLWLQQASPGYHLLSSTRPDFWISNRIGYGTFEWHALNSYVVEGQQNSYLLVQLTMFAGCSEEDAIALAIREHGITLERYQQDYLELYREIQSAASTSFRASIKAMISRSMVKWKESRFTHTPVPSEKLWRSVFDFFTMNQLMHEFLKLNRIQVRCDDQSEWTHDLTAISCLTELIGAGNPTVQLPLRYFTLQFQVNEVLILDWRAFARLFLEWMTPSILLLSCYFRLFFPAALIRNTDDTAWKEISDMRQHNHTATHFMYQYTKSMCSRQMVEEIHRLTELVEAKQRHTIPPTMLSMCNAMYIMLKAVDDLAKDPTRRKMLAMLRQILRHPTTEQMPLTGCNETQLIEAGVSYLTAHLALYGQIEQGVDRFLQTHMQAVTTENVMRVIARIFKGIAQQPTVREFEKECVQHYHTRATKGKIARWKLLLGKAVTQRDQEML